MADVRRDATTAIQATNLQKRRTALLKRIQKFTELQPTFMPGLKSYLNRHHASSERSNKILPEAIPLHLPSAIPTSYRRNVCSVVLSNTEDELRYAHAVEALSGLRRQLRTRTMASKLTRRDAASQCAFTRSRALQDQVEVRIRQWQGRYNMARAAVLSLRGSGDWEKTLAVLSHEDVRGISERTMTMEEKEVYKLTWRMAGLTEDSSDDNLSAPVVPFDPRLALGEGRQTLSWIWYSVSDRELQGDAACESLVISLYIWIDKT